MVASYDEFAAEHRAEHLKPFNRWCAVVENGLAITGALAMVLGRRKAGVALIGLGSAMGGVGHVVEGNLPRALHDAARHPIWSVRADFAVARATITGHSSRPRRAHCEGGLTNRGPSAVSTSQRGVGSPTPSAHASSESHDAHTAVDSAGTTPRDMRVCHRDRLV
jgi:hypothetical protein